MKCPSLLFGLLLAAASAFCGSPGEREFRQGDEIVVAGQMFHTGTKVVLWMDPGGYDAYRVERRFVPIAQAGWGVSKAHLFSPNRYGIREATLSPAQIERIRGGGWDLPTLQSVIDQFVLHYDVEGYSRGTFKALQDKAGLSVHFMLDLDGTIYQTLDVKEAAWHATIANNRSIGVEIANVGSYLAEDKNPFPQWYKKDASGRVTLNIPAFAGPHPEWTSPFTGHPARREIIKGPIHGKMRSQYDYTPQQYEALAKLTATLCTIFPKLKCDYPREADGKLMLHKMPEQEWKNYEGVLGHYHVQTDKEDPGPALQWDYVIGEARLLMGLPPAKNVRGEIVTNAPKLLEDN